MNRRKFTIGLGTLAASSAAAVGSGAFTSVEASRNVSVEVTGDASAFVQLEGDGDYVTNDNGGSLSIDIGGATTDAGGQGLNDRARTEIPGIVTIRNQGTQAINVGFGNTPSLSEQFAFEGEDGTNQNDTLVTLRIEYEGPADDPNAIGTGNATTMSVVADSRDDAFDDVDITPGEDTQTLELTAFEPSEYPDFPEDDGGAGFQ